jgi:hypothetical protein
VKNHARLKELLAELKAARADGSLTVTQARRIRTEAEVAAENDPRFLESFFHNTPPELQPQPSAVR